jgi:MFS family permease
VLTGASVVGKLVVGFLSDYIDAKRILIFVVLSHLATLAALLMIPDYRTLLAAIAVVGIGVGGVLPLQAVLLSRIFGRASFGAALGLTGLIFQPISIAALRWSGSARDSSGSYALAFQGMLAAVGIALLLILFLKPAPPPVRHVTTER